MKRMLCMHPIATTIQLRNDRELRCALLRGTPTRCNPGTLGPIALFTTSQLVVYEIRQPHHHHAYGFFTAAPRGTALLPGVYPAVPLVLSAHTSGQITRMMQALALLDSDRLHTLPLSDTSLTQKWEPFFSRLQAMLTARPFCFGDIKRWVSTLLEPPSP